MSPDTQPGLAGKCALVTGAASGIGHATAAMLVRQGARVVLADLNAGAVAEACTALGGLASVSGDISDDAACRRIVEDSLGHLGRIDILINAAGIADERAPAESLDIDAWQRVIDVDLRGTFLISRAAGTAMLTQGTGAIVNISSICGYGAFPGRSAYGAAKAAVNHLTQTLACEWGPRGVRVNAIAPGYTRTPLVADLVARKVFDPAAIIARTPLGRMAEPEEMAQAALFLASDQASYITGTVLMVDGGWTAFGAAGSFGG